MRTRPKGRWALWVIGVVGLWASAALGLKSGPAGARCPFEKRPAVRVDYARTAARWGATVATPHGIERADGGAAPLAMPRFNFIDDYIRAKLEAQNLPSASLCTDAEFLRRVSLDLTGRIPTPDAVRAFLADPEAGKRDRLIQSLMDTPAFVDRWTQWYGDFLRNSVYPTGPDGRNQLYLYLKNAVAQNTPYHQIITDLLTANGDTFAVGPLSYLMRAGIVSDVGLMDSFDDMAAAVTRDFLGIKSLCISCHQGSGYLDRINLWLTRKRREDFWGQAAFFTQMTIQARMLSDMMSYRYRVADGGPGIYDPSQLGGEDDSFRPPRRMTEPIRARYIVDGRTLEGTTPYRQGLARRITSDAQMARAAVNYLWTTLMVRGLVEPPDNFDLARLDPNSPPSGDDPTTRWWRENEPVQPSHPELLNALAQEFMANGYDMRRMMRLICQSATYQLSSTYTGPWRPDYERYYARRLSRLLTSEEIHDAIVQATGLWSTYVNYGSSEPVQWAMQLRGPEDPADIDDRADEARSLLDAFGRGDRDRIERVTNKFNLFQPLQLMHSPFVRRRIDPSQDGSLKRLLESRRSDQEIIDELFLATLSRYPSLDERKLALIKFKVDRPTAASDLLWVLLNKLDFMFN